jgi:hypothetical protein
MALIDCNIQSKMFFIVTLHYCNYYQSLNFKGFTDYKEHIMKTSTKSISLSIKFNQLVELVKQLPYEEKVKLGEVIRKETKTNIENDKVFTHFASEKL